MQIQKQKAIAIPLIFIGVLILILDFLSYQSFQPLVITDENSVLIQKVSYIFYMLLFSGVVLIAFGFLKMIQVFHKGNDYQPSPTNTLPHSLSKIIISILNDKKYFRFFWPVSIGYAVFYATISGMLIYRSDSFSSLYGVTIPSITMITYGPMGYVPTMAAYFTEHIGLLIMPINFFIILIVSALVGFNTVLSIYAFDNRPKRSAATTTTTAHFLGAIGVTTSLFAACPTCASFYLFTIMAGSLAPTVAAFTATFYAVFIALSIPLLIVTPFLTALSLRRALFSQCSLDKNEKKQ
ncbi:MAG: hypothetical protein JO297_20665 [Nitrososphaeraceae archaeon]|nr:hypothetical protein [Nitrososphaeraceae archaeon]